MICSNCGTELPDDANFCVQCGRPQKAGLAGPIARAQWELCEIDYFSEEGFLNQKGLFGAMVLGKERKQLVAESENFLLRFDEVGGFNQWRSKRILKRTAEAQSAFNALVGRLLDEGWEPTGWGQFWYSEQLRRRVD